VLRKYIYRFSNLRKLHWKFHYHKKGRMEFLRLFSEINLCCPSFKPRKVKYDDVLLFKHSYYICSAFSATIIEKVKECKKTVYSDYNQYSCRLAEVLTILYLYIRNNDMHISPYIGGHRMVKIPNCATV
jgi:hypothetical protein